MGKLGVGTGRGEGGSDGCTVHEVMGRGGEEVGCFMHVQGCRVQGDTDGPADMAGGNGVATYTSVLQRSQRPEADTGFLPGVGAQ